MLAGSDGEEDALQSKQTNKQHPTDEFHDLSVQEKGRVARYASFASHHEHYHIYMRPQD